MKSAVRLPAGINVLMLHMTRFLTVDCRRQDFALQSELLQLLGVTVQSELHLQNLQKTTSFLLHQSTKLMLDQ